MCVYSQCSHCHLYRLDITIKHLKTRIVHFESYFSFMNHIIGQLTTNTSKSRKIKSMEKSIHLIYQLKPLYLDLLFFLASEQGIALCFRLLQIEYLVTNLYELPYSS